MEIVPVLLDVSEGGENETWIWQFSAEPVDAARDLFIALEDMPRDELADAEASSPFFELRSQIRAVNRILLNQVGGVELWQWLTLMAWLLVSIPISWLLSWLIVRVLRLGRNAGLQDDNTKVTVRFSVPLLLILFAWSGLLHLGWLGLPQNVDIPLRIAFGVILSIAGGWLAYNLVDRISHFFALDPKISKYRDEILHSLLTSVAKLVVIISAILFLAEVLSLPYQGVLAGLGIGGLAVALAARSTVEYFIGGITCSLTNPRERAISAGLAKRSE